jgi:D-alanine-D-alanine ligase
VFPVLHGEFGEDGKIQQLLESVQLAYVGSGVQASAQAMDKDLAKQAFVAVGMSVAEGFAVSQNDWKEKTSNIQYPVFVKPSSGGSSRGTHKVKSNDDLQMALEDAFLYDSKVLIESAVIGREIECAVLERNGSLEASMPGEIVVDPKFEFYDFEAKYLDNATTVKVPANISELDSAEIRRLAMKAFRSLSCSGLARCDFFYTNEGKIIINEVNTMPGFTGTSVYPKLWQASGVTYTELISTLIDSALQK